MAVVDAADAATRAGILGLLTSMPPAPTQSESA
jgi:hypothetical protein